MSGPRGGVWKITKEEQEYYFRSQGPPDAAEPLKPKSGVRWTRKRRVVSDEKPTKRYTGGGRCREQKRQGVV